MELVYSVRHIHRKVVPMLIVATDTRPCWTFVETVTVIGHLQCMWPSAVSVAGVQCWHDSVI